MNQRNKWKPGGRPRKRSDRLRQTAVIEDIQQTEHIVPLVPRKKKKGA